MATENKQGVVIRDSKKGGTITTSNMSAHSGERLNTAAITTPVPKTPHVFVRINPSERVSMSDADKSAMFERALQWVGEKYPDYRDKPTAKTPKTLKKEDDE